MAKRTCSIDGCERLSNARGWCRMHYMRWWTFGDPSHQRLSLPTEHERFWSKVHKNPDGCWLWTAAITGPGYGLFTIGSKTNGTRRGVYAHRYAYEDVSAPIPDGLQIDHLCRVRHCVNPAHLEPVTHAENVRRGVVARKTLASKGADQ